jgi:hypothetical protein
MAPVTTPGEKVKASKADLSDPKQLLKARHLNLYEQLNKVDPLTGEAGKMNKKMEDMTQGELLSAIADEGDKNHLCGKYQKQFTDDPRTWKFEGRIQELLNAYSAKFVPEEPFLADDVERFCICNGPDDGRPMIQCSHSPACLMDWFHLECVGMQIDEIPKERGLSARSSVLKTTNKLAEDWFCECCVEKNLGVLRKKRPKSIFKSVAKKSNADRIKHYKVGEQAATEAIAKEDDSRRKKFVKNQTSRAKAKQKPKPKDLTIHTASPKPLEMPSPSPDTPKPWTAELDKAFAEDPEVTETYGLGSLASAKVALRQRGTIATPNIATKTTNTKDDSDSKISQTASKPILKRNKGSWTREEKDHLIACVTASQQANLPRQRLMG